MKRLKEIIKNLPHKTSPILLKMLTLIIMDKKISEPERWLIQYKFFRGLLPNDLSVFRGSGSNIYDLFSGIKKIFTSLCHNHCSHRFDRHSLNCYECCPIERGFLGFLKTLWGEFR